MCRKHAAAYLMRHEDRRHSVRGGIPPVTALEYSACVFGYEESETDRSRLGRWLSSFEEGRRIHPGGLTLLDKLDPNNAVPGQAPLR